MDSRGRPEAGRRGRRGASWAARSWCKYSISFSYQWKPSCLDTCTAVIGVSHDLHIIWLFKIPFFCIHNTIFLLLTRVFLARNNSVNPCLKLPILHLPVVKMADRGFSRQQWERHKTCPVSAAGETKKSRRSGRFSSRMRTIQNRSLESSCFKTVVVCVCRDFGVAEKRVSVILFCLPQTLLCTIILKTCLLSRRNQDN